MEPVIDVIVSLMIPFIKRDNPPGSCPLFHALPINNNFVKTHRTLATPYPKTPAMASGITDHIWTTEEIVKLIYNNMVS
jgi:hypothetical protein